MEASSSAGGLDWAWRGAQERGMRVRLTRRSVLAEERCSSSTAVRGWCEGVLVSLERVGKALARCTLEDHFVSVVRREVSKLLS